MTGRLLESHVDLSGGDVDVHVRLPVRIEVVGLAGQNGFFRDDLVADVRAHLADTAGCVELAFLGWAA